MLIGKIKLSEIIYSGEASRQLMQTKIDIKISFWIAKIAKKCDDIIKIYNDTITIKIKEIKNEMVLKDEEGNFKMTEDKSNFLFKEGFDREKYLNKIDEITKELQKEEVDFENIEKIKLSKLGNIDEKGNFKRIEIEPKYIAMLLWMIDYDLDTTTNN